MTKPPAAQTRHQTSEYMVQFMRAIEKRLLRHLTPDEARSPLYIAAARVYADALLHQASDQKKGQETK
jgi:hypothetical protein